MITGWTTVGMGAAALLLAFLDLPFKDRIINLSISVLIMLIGAFLLIACTYAQRIKRTRKFAAGPVKSL